MLIYIDGELRPREAATVSVFDHGLLYGDGVFEGIRVYNRRIFRLDAHLDRLYDSARAIALEIPLAPAEMAEAVRRTVRENRKEDGYIRLVVTRGVGDLGIDPRKCARPTRDHHRHRHPGLSRGALRRGHQGHHLGHAPGVARGVRPARSSRSTT